MSWFCFVMQPASMPNQIFVNLERTRSLIVYLVSYDCKCSLVVPHSALDLAAVCECDIS